VTSWMAELSTDAHALLALLGMFLKVGWPHSRTLASISTEPPTSKEVSPLPSSGDYAVNGLEGGRGRGDANGGSDGSGNSLSGLGASDRGEGLLPP
jgi:hypothetical protein